MCEWENPVTVEQPPNIHADSIRTFWEDGLNWWPVEEDRYEDGLLHCRYCGGITPEDFVRLLEGGGSRVEVADWKYGWPHKVYIDFPNPEPDRIRVVSHTDDPSSWGGADQWVAAGDLTEEQQEAVERWRSPTYDSNPAYFMFTTDVTKRAKFYTIHLTDLPDLEAHADLIHARTGVRFAKNDEGKLVWRGRPRGLL